MTTCPSLWASCGCGPPAPPADTTVSRISSPIWGRRSFPRIKIGTGAPSGGGAEMIDWVIGVPSRAERKILVESFENAVKAAEDIIENGCQKAMNDYN